MDQDQAHAPAPMEVENGIEAAVLGAVRDLPDAVVQHCLDVLVLMRSCNHEELAEIRAMLTAVRQLPGTPEASKAVLRSAADLVRDLDRFGAGSRSQPTA